MSKHDYAYEPRVKVKEAESVCKECLECLSVSYVGQVYYAAKSRAAHTDTISTWRVCLAVVKILGKLLEKYFSGYEPMRNGF